MIEVFEDVDRLDIDDMPDTDLLDEKQDEIGVGRRLGEEEVER